MVTKIVVHSNFRWKLHNSSPTLVDDQLTMIELPCEYYYQVGKSIGRLNRNELLKEEEAFPIEVSLISNGQFEVCLLFPRRKSFFRS